MEALPILTLTVTDGTDAISGATVTIGEDSDTTDADGQVEFELEYGDYSATIEASGYTTATESLAFRSNHKNFTVSLESATGTGTVTVTCTEGGAIPIEDVTVTLKQDSQTVKTGTSGEGGVCVLEDVPYGTYTLEADDDMWGAYSGSLTVDGDETVTVTLEVPI